MLDVDGEVGLAHPLLQVDGDVEGTADHGRGFAQAFLPRLDVGCAVEVVVVGVEVDLELGELDPPAGIDVVEGFGQQARPVLDGPAEHADVDVVVRVAEPHVLGVVDEEFDIGRNPGQVSTKTETVQGVAIGSPTMPAE